MCPHPCFCQRIMGFYVPKLQCDNEVCKTLHQTLKELNMQAIVLNFWKFHCTVAVHSWRKNSGN